VIQNLNFTDNIKIINLLEAHPHSVFNLLDQSCTMNVKDDDFLSQVKKHHDQHEHFPGSNLINTRKSFIIKHTPGDIEYMIEGFREKNKDLVR
jgi:myosin heavy subunit